MLTLVAQAPRCGNMVTPSKQPCRTLVPTRLLLIVMPMQQGMGNSHF